MRLFACVTVAAEVRGEVRVVVKNVGGVEERVFTWPLPAAR